MVKHGLTLGIWIKDKLTQAGGDGACPTDLHRELKQNWPALGSPYIKGNRTYASFCRYWAILKKLGFIEPTGRTEVSHQKGGTLALQVPRTFYKLSAKGRRASIASWNNPRTLLNPGAATRNRKRYFSAYRERKRVEAPLQGEAA